jgi:hypothetical protein
MTYARVNTYIEVDLEEIDTDDLIAELKSRGERPELVEMDSYYSLTDTLYNALRCKNTKAVEEIHRRMAYVVLGKIL